MTKTLTAADRIADDIRTILNQGGDPRRYRDGLAELRRVPVETIDAAIAAIGGSPRIVDEETVAQERLADDRRMARTHRAAYREYQHEEA